MGAAEVAVSPFATAAVDGKLVPSTAVGTVVFSAQQQQQPAPQQQPWSTTLASVAEGAAAVASIRRLLSRPELFVPSSALKHVRQLGCGGFARVSLASHTSGNGTRCKVAVKHFHESVLTDDTLLALIASEVEMALKIDHQNACKLIGIGATDPTSDESIRSTLYLVLEHLPGMALKEIINVQTTNFGAFGVTSVDMVMWAQQLASALASLHEFSPPILHRDVKLDNALLTVQLHPGLAFSKEPKGQVKLIDFGLARHLPSTIGLQHSGTLRTAQPVAPSHRSEQESDWNHALLDVQQQPSLPTMRALFTSSSLKSVLTGSTYKKASLPRHRPATQDLDVPGELMPTSIASPFAVHAHALSPPSINEGRSVLDCRVHPKLGLPPIPKAARPHVRLRSTCISSGRTTLGAPQHCQHGGRCMKLGSALGTAPGAFRTQLQLAGGPMSERCSDSSSSQAKPRGVYCPSERYARFNSAGAVQLATPGNGGQGCADGYSCKQKIGERVSTGAGCDIRFVDDGSGDALQQSVPLQQALDGRAANTQSHECASDVLSGWRQNELVSCPSNAAGVFDTSMLQLLPNDGPPVSLAHASTRSGGHGAEGSNSQLLLAPAPKLHLQGSLSATVPTAQLQLTGQTGSLLYMAPEVFKGQSYNEKADVFSFGMCLYEMLNRKLVLSTVLENAEAKNPWIDFQGREDAILEYAQAVSAGYRPPLSARMPERLAKLIRSCWSEDPSLRPSMQGVVAELAAVLEQPTQLAPLDKDPLAPGCCIMS